MALYCLLFMKQEFTRYEENAKPNRDALGIVGLRWNSKSTEWYISGQWHGGTLLSYPKETYRLGIGISHFISRDSPIN